LTEEEGLALVRNCIDEVKKRVIIDLTHFRAIIINADGSQVIENIKPTDE
jgi:hypothetical protein